MLSCSNPGFFQHDTMSWADQPDNRPATRKRGLANSARKRLPGESANRKRNKKTPRQESTGS